MAKGIYINTENSGVKKAKKLWVNTNNGVKKVKKAWVCVSTDPLQVNLVYVAGYKYDQPVWQITMSDVPDTYNLNGTYTKPSIDDDGIINPLTNVKEINVNDFYASNNNTVYTGIEDNVLNSVVIRSARDEFYEDDPNDLGTDQGIIRINAIGAYNDYGFKNNFYHGVGNLKYYGATYNNISTNQKIYATAENNTSLVTYIYKGSEDQERYWESTSSSSYEYEQDVTENSIAGYDGYEPFGNYFTYVNNSYTQVYANEDEPGVRQGPVYTFFGNEPITNNPIPNGGSSVMATYITYIGTPNGTNTWRFDTVTRTINGEKELISKFQKYVKNRIGPKYKYTLDFQIEKVIEGE